MALLQVGHAVLDDGANGVRRRLAEVGDERLRDGLAKQAEQGDQDEQAREDRLDAEVGQCCRAGLQVIILYSFRARLPASCRELSRISVGVIQHILAGAPAHILRPGHQR